MPSLVAYTIGAYTPAYDAKQLKDFSVIDGKNFMPTIQGYKSEFGSSPLTDRRLSEETLIGGQTFSIGETTLVLCNNYGILFYDPDSEAFAYQVRQVDSLDSYYPWSMAYVGGDYYFCHRGFGVYRYRPNDNSWLKLIDNVPANPISVCSSDGRLVVLGESTYAWSAVGDGTDLATSLTTGAGFQALSIAGGGSPLAVKTYTNGFMVYTTSGIVRAESISAINPFYHKVLASGDYAPLAPKAITEVGNSTHVFLTRTGLFATSGDFPEAFEPDFSSWLTGTLLRSLISSKYNLPISMTYSTTNRWIIISYSEYSIVPSPYSLAFVYDVSLQRWGRFDQSHYFIGVGYIPKGNNKGYRLLTATRDNVIRVFDKDYAISLAVDTNNRDNYPTVCPNNYVVSATTDPAAGLNVTVFTACARIDTYNFTALPKNEIGYYVYDAIYSTPKPDLVYPNIPDNRGYSVVVDMMDCIGRVVDMMDMPEGSLIDMKGADIPYNIAVARAVAGTGMSVMAEVKLAPELGLLDSQIKTGLVHVAEFDDCNQATVITGFSAIQDEWVGEDTIIDMEKIADIVIDMETVSDEIIDMGMLSISKPAYDAILVSSSDGYGNLGYHRYSLEPVSVAGNRYNYNAYSTGLYHGFELATKEAGDFFHLKQLQLNIFQGGLIYDRT